MLVNIVCFVAVLLMVALYLYSYREIIGKMGTGPKTVIVKESIPKYLAIRPYNVSVDSSGNVVDADVAYLKQLGTFSDNEAVRFFFYLVREKLIHNLKDCSTDQTQTLGGMIAGTDLILGELYRMKRKYDEVVADEEEQQ